MIDLATLLSEHGNHVEIYICPQMVHESTSIKVGWRNAIKLDSLRLGNGSQQHIKEYYHRDMVYTYDLTNDGQRVYRKLAQNDLCYDRIYAVSYIEEVLPTHRFPCTCDTAHEMTVHRTTYRINNRMYFVHDIEDDQNHYYYVKYQHAQNVDMKKMQQDLDHVLARIKQIRL